jgi:hypothetical protein
MRDAAAAARAEPDFTLIFMVFSLWKVLCFHAVVCAGQKPGHEGGYGCPAGDVSGFGKKIEPPSLRMTMGALATRQIIPDWL